MSDISNYDESLDPFEVPMEEPPLGNNSGSQLSRYLEVIEKLEEDKAGIAADIKAVYADAKDNGFDTKAIRRIVKIRKDINGYKEEEEMVILYLDAIGIKF